MKKKRMIKLLMSIGCDRNDAAWAAMLTSGNLPHAVLYYELLGEFIRAYYEHLDKTVVEGDMTGAVVGMLGASYMDEYCIVKQRAGPLVKVFSTDRACFLRKNGDCMVVKIESDREYGQIKLEGDRG